MKLPGALAVNVTSVSPVSARNELFCFHISPYASKGYLSEYFEVINELLPEFCFSKQNLAIHQERFDKGQSKKNPLAIAREFLQDTIEGRSYDSGEMAEFLLFLFAKKVKGAHKLVTKVQSRGSTRKTIPGRDNSFVYEDDDGHVYMLLGEAKSKPEPNDALREGQTDINAFWETDDIKHELNLASTHIRSEMNSDNWTLYENFFIDTNDKNSELQYKNIVFVTYSLEAFKNLVSGSISESDFQAAVTKDLKRCFENQKKIITDSKHPTIYCFVPFECINVARDMFAETNNLVYTK